MSEETLEQICEDWGTRVITESELLPPTFQVCRHDENPRAKSNRIVFTAKAGDKQTEGPEAYEVTMEIALIMTERDRDKVDEYAKIIEELFEQARNGNGLSPDTEDVSYFQVTGFGDNDKESKKNARRRVKVLQILALEND